MVEDVGDTVYENVREVVEGVVNFAVRGVDDDENSTEKFDCSKRVRSVEKVVEQGVGSILEKYAIDVPPHASPSATESEQVTARNPESSPTGLAGSQSGTEKIACGNTAPSVEQVVEQGVASILESVKHAIDAPPHVYSSGAKTKQVTARDPPSNPVRLAGLRAILQLFAFCVGVNNNSYQVCEEAMRNLAKNFGLNKVDVAEALDKAQTPLDFIEWEGFTSSLAVTFLMSCSDPKLEAVEVLLWITHAIVRDGLSLPYDARIRAGLRRVAEHLHVPWKTVATFEMAMVASYYGSIDQRNKQEIQQTIGQRENKQEDDWTRTAAITAAATLGAGALAATGILALPAVGAALTGIGSVTGIGIFETAAAVAASSAGAALTGSTLGIAGAGLLGSKMHRRLHGIEQFEFQDMSTVPCSKAAVTIAISGWVTKRSDFTEHWRGLSGILHEEVNCLVWEEKELTDLGNMLSHILYDQAASRAIEFVVKRTIFKGLLSAAAWPVAFIEASNLIDNAWSVAVNRTDDAGKALAEVLIRNVAGHRPVSLVGFSLGARVIFQALGELDKADRLDIVENVVLLGAPVASTYEDWERTRVVAGRVISVYNPKDWVLYFMYRGAQLQFGVAGLEPVRHRRVENVNLVEELKLGSNYLDGLDQILKKLNLFSR